MRLTGDVKRARNVLQIDVRIENLSDAPNNSDCR